MDEKCQMKIACNCYKNLITPLNFPHKLLMNNLCEPPCTCDEVINCGKV